MGVKGRMPEGPVEAILQIFGKGMFEPLGFGVNAFERNFEGFGEE